MTPVLVLCYAHACAIVHAFLQQLPQQLPGLEHADAAVLPPQDTLPRQFSLCDEMVDLLPTEMTRCCSSSRPSDTLLLIQLRRSSARYSSRLTNIVHIRILNAFGLVFLLFLASAERTPSADIRPFENLGAIPAADVASKYQNKAL
jgi:hypothetical protein